MRTLITFVFSFFFYFFFSFVSFAQSITSVAHSITDIETVTLKYNDSNIETEIQKYHSTRIIIETTVSCQCSETVKKALQGLYAPKITNNGTQAIIEPQKNTQPLFINGVEIPYSITHIIKLPQTHFDNMMNK